MAVLSIEDSLDAKFPIHQIGVVLVLNANKTDSLHRFVRMFFHCQDMHTIHVIKLRFYLIPISFSILIFCVVCLGCY